jgi:hypothetical protein
LHLRILNYSHRLPPDQDIKTCDAVGVTFLFRKSTTRFSLREDYFFAPT